MGGRAVVAASGRRTSHESIVSGFGNQHPVRGQGKKAIVDLRCLPMKEIEKVKLLFSELPPKHDEIRGILDRDRPTKEDLAEIAYNVASYCFCEYRDAVDPTINEVSVDLMHSNYLLDSLQLLLEYGLNPNTITAQGDNVLWELQWVDAPNIGPAALRLLLEHGGNPNLILPEEGESLFEYVSFCISEDDHDHSWFYKVQFWWVLMAFGGSYDNGNIPIEMLNGKRPDIF